MNRGLCEHLSSVVACLGEYVDMNLSTNVLTSAEPGVDATYP